MNDNSPSPTRSSFKKRKEETDLRVNNSPAIPLEASETLESYNDGTFATDRSDNLQDELQVMTELLSKVKFFKERDIVKK